MLPELRTSTRLDISSYLPLIGIGAPLAVKAVSYASQSLAEPWAYSRVDTAHCCISNSCIWTVINCLWVWLHDKSHPYAQWSNKTHLPSSCVFINGHVPKAQQQPVINNDGEHKTDQTNVYALSHNSPQWPCQPADLPLNAQFLFAFLGVFEKLEPIHISLREIKKTPLKFSTSANNCDCCYCKVWQRFIQAHRGLKSMCSTSTGVSQLEKGGKIHPISVIQHQNVCPAKGQDALL